MAQPDRLQIKIWHSQTGCRWKYGTGREATDENIIWSRCIACWLPKVTNMQCLLLLHCNNGCTSTPQCYVMRTLSVLFTIILHYKRHWLATMTKHGERERERSSQRKSEVQSQEERKDNRRKNWRENRNTNNSTKCSSYWMFWCNHHHHYYLLSLPLLHVIIIFSVIIIIINIHYRLKTCPSVFADFRIVPTCK